MEKILFAMVGATTASGKPSGFLCQGMCIPLAATEGARSVIEELGEDAVPDWLVACEVDAPQAGGLWTLMLDIDNDDDAPQGFDVTKYHWVIPTTAELTGLLAKQVARVLGDRTMTKPFAAEAWTWIGGLV